jgi:hypothetical protein
MRYAQWTIVATMVLAAGTAFADDPLSSTPDPNAAAGSGSGSGSSAGGIAAASGGAVAGGPIINDNLVLSKGELGVVGGLGILSSSEQSATPPVMTITTNTELLAIGAGYGVTDQITAGLTWNIPINASPGGAFPDAGQLDFYGGYQILRNDKMVLAAGADLDLVFTPNTTAALINLGATFRYNLTPMIALYTGDPIAPSAVGQQLSISTASKGVIGLTIPVGVAVQPIPALFAWGQTTLFDFQFAPTGNTDVIFADFIPLEIGALYRVTPAIDVGGELAFSDLEHLGSTADVDFFVLARYRRHVN